MQLLLFVEFGTRSECYNSLDNYYNKSSKDNNDKKSFSVDVSVLHLTLAKVTRLPRLPLQLCCYCGNGRSHDNSDLERVCIFTKPTPALSNF